jgi:YHS domain
MCVGDRHDVSLAGKLHGRLATIGVIVLPWRPHRGYYFCSAGCKESFDKDPAKYLAGKG